MNSRIIGNVFEAIRLAADYNPKELAKPSSREMILFLTQLYNTLPHYIPKGQPVVFSCVLGEDVSKTIELKNDSSKCISYWVKFEGSADFLLENTDFIKIEPRTVFKFKVDFKSRVSIL